MKSCACISPIHRRGVKLCSIILFPRFKISSFKCNLRHFLSLIYLFPKLLPSWFFVSYDLAPDLDHVHRIAQVFSKPSNIDPCTSRLRIQTPFTRPLSCDPETDITKPNSRDIVVSADMDPDMLACLDSGRVIAWVFREPFILNSSWCQLWIRMARYLNYISSRYIFISSLASLTKSVGRKLNNLMWLRMAG